METIQAFESGQVYEVMFKDILGEFLTYDQMLNKKVKKNKRVSSSNDENSNFLIYIVNQNAMIND